MIQLWSQACTEQFLVGAIGIGGPILAIILIAWIIKKIRDRRA